MLGSIASLRLARASYVGSLGVVAWLGLLGCTETRESPGGLAAIPSSDRGRLVIELPLGISVGLRGQEPVPLPVDPLEVAPGAHTLVLASACQRVELTVDVPAGETLVVDRERATGLEWATLQVTAKDRDGKPQMHAVLLGDTVVGGGHGASTTTVPACPYRVRVAHDGPELLGGVVEDIDFGTQRELARTVVLAPGPDMVRLSGGKFTLGPPEALEERWVDDYGQLIFAQHPVEVAAFEIDRTELTAAQWNECRARANPQRCFSEADCERAVGCPQRAYLVTHFPPEGDRPYCNADLVDVLRPVKGGREDHPMNCVARWEAEDYCRWAGKRLPTAIEWEYAARSGDDRTLWPWGNEEPTCEHGRIHMPPACQEMGTVPVCSHPKGSTKQGVCDFIGNVEEYVEDVPETRPPSGLGDHGWESFTCMGPGWEGDVREVLLGKACVRIHRQEPHIGFRCARTIEHR